MDSTKARPPSPADTADLGAGGPERPGASTVDLSSPPGSERGALTDLLGAVASAPAALPPIELGPGDSLGAAYQIVRRLGAGGMGVVYLARDLELQREVAVKVHRASVGTERLYREAVAMAQLAHPHVVAIHGVGRVLGRLYIAMEYVPGDNLAAWLRARPRPWRDVLDVMLGVGEGLAVAHDAGFVHRDVKPANILVGVDGRARIGDFGLVRVAGDGARADGESAPEPAPTIGPEARAPATPTSDADAHAAAVADTMVPPSDRPPSSRPPSRPSNPSPLASDLTAYGSTLGTPAYMAPEQLTGGVVDARADQFAFCLVLYEALYGQRPWPGKTVAELQEQLASQPPREPDRRAAPTWIWPVLRRGLARDPAARHRDLRALLDQLRSPPRRIWLAAALAGVVVLSAALAVVKVRGATPSRSCDAFAAQVATVWGPDAQSVVRAHYVFLDRQAGPDAVRRFATEVDAWAQGWRRAAATSCNSRRSSRWSADVSAASERCLEASLAELRTLIEKAQKGPALIVDAGGLSDVGRCADPVALTDAPPLPASELVGYWRGDYGQLLFGRVGDEIRGVYRHDLGTIRGTVVGDRFVGWWCEGPSRKPPGDAGDVEMQVIEDRSGVRGVAGRWRYGTTGEWDDRWDLTRDPEDPPAMLQARLALGADFCLRPTD